ncbi:hypothetical protein H8S90_10180 [Olivibacter sp. SDN3]|uniref:hypothetical protein n=1 Tax=Olivibacter sp. SDN3 TaxID=2764720 RepID=UPI00165115D3|nr:hypothetical protein [Olivibacter sp. SDN3]QNL51906.1 hypothetical protein H8S90_10180 [Olivibacter sp. SDN3]
MMKCFYLFTLYLSLICLPFFVKAQIQIFSDAPDELIWALNRFEQEVRETGATLSKAVSLETLGTGNALAVITSEEKMQTLASEFPGFSPSSIQEEGYALQWAKYGRLLFIFAKDPLGAQYGLQDVAEHYRKHRKLQGMVAKVNNPYLNYRILKFNLPWSPYRRSKASSVHEETCRDLKFWERLLDMMAENRLNVLSLWSNHPFPFMVRSATYPAASPFNDRELAEWKSFWTALFALAKERDIQTFIVNWNIVVSPSFAAAYGAKEYSDLSTQVIDYTRESVRQTIDEYPDLTGIGVTLADWMGNFPDKLSAQQREDWIAKTFVAAMQEASRPIKFLHRSVLAGDPIAMRELIDQAKLKDRALVEIKFNWSHGHSTPDLAITHDYHSGEVDRRFWDPQPENYDIQWMVRNEDFFILRWGQADFIRKHLLANKAPGVNGYFIGSEGYIPAADYATIALNEQSWDYAFEKQWLFYKLWGRLLYDPNYADKHFIEELNRRYGATASLPLWTAYQLASKMPLRLASFFRSTWDYTLYSEGFIAAEPADPSDSTFNRNSPFIAIQDLIHHPTLDTSLLSIGTFVQQELDGAVAQDKTNPLELAAQSERDSRESLAMLRKIEKNLQPTGSTLLSEVQDLAVWSYLGLYLSDKIRAATAAHRYQISGDSREKRQALQYIDKCQQHWDEVIRLTKHRYRAVPHVSTENYDHHFQAFSWELMRPHVLDDIEWVKALTYNKKQ